MKFKLDENNLKWGTTAFLVIVASMLVFFSLLRLDSTKSGLDTFMGIMSPFIWGFVIAYLLCPIYNGVVRWTYATLNKGERKFKKALFFAKLAGTIISLAVLITVIIGISWMIIPGLYESIVNIVDMLPSSKQVVIDWIDAKLSKVPIAEIKISQYINDSTDNLIKFATEYFLPHYTTIAMGISSGIIGAVNLMKNVLIGIIVSVYFLNSKDIFAAQIKKGLFAIFKEKTAEGILDFGKYTNKSFGGFISGKIIDSAIIGVICFVCMSVLGWEYSLLISCIIGITNVIPFFGPFIGAIPSALLLLMVTPIHALYFIIFVVLLQQFDGNILGPKILGESTGLSSFWVLFSVLVGGGLFGVVGMIVAIPICAVIFYYATNFVNGRLEKKGFSSSLVDYKIDSYRTVDRAPVEHKGVMKLIDKQTKANKIKKVNLERQEKQARRAGNTSENQEKDNHKDHE